MTTKYVIIIFEKKHIPSISLTEKSAIMLGIY